MYRNACRRVARKQRKNHKLSLCRSTLPIPSFWMMGTTTSDVNVKYSYSNLSPSAPVRMVEVLPQVVVAQEAHRQARASSSSRGGCFSRVRTEQSVQAKSPHPSGRPHRDLAVSPPRPTFRAVPRRHPSSARWGAEIGREGG